VIVRQAGALDAPAIAKLHAESWRANYRGTFRDDFLDGPAFDERRRIWDGRFREFGTSTNQIVFVVDDKGAVNAFVCVLLDADPVWGALVDNLHVAPDLKGRGFGRRLLAEAARWVHQQRSGSKLFLWVHETNDAARGFYEHLGGIAVGSETHEGPEGSRVTAIRYAWGDVQALVTKLSA